jgi:hypothetical protein
VCVCLCVCGEHMMHATRGKVQVMQRRTCKMPRALQGALPAAERRSRSPSRTHTPPAAIDLAPVFYTSVFFL